VFLEWNISIYSYLFGHPFDLITDHKPLLGLFGEGKPIFVLASARFAVGLCTCPCLSIL